MSEYEEFVSNQLDKENNKKSRFLFYLWGVFCTAYARRNLWSGIFECKSDYIYLDTDSVKILHYAKHKAYFDRYNQEITEKLERAMDYHHFSHDLIRPSNIKGELSKAHIVHFFDDASEYCTFIRLLTQGNVKHHFACRAQFPAIYKSSRHWVYCEKYEGLYGRGWRIVLFRAGKGFHNNIVKYYIVGEPKHSNQLDSKGTENERDERDERVQSKFSREVQRRKSDDD